MSYKPILFSTPMVQAILEGSKTMTRRVARPTAVNSFYVCEVDGVIACVDESTGDWYKPTAPAPYQVDDILWVRETWREWVGGYSYKADAQDTFQWRSARYMPKKAARIFLRVTDVRVERLQDITINDVHREGVIGELCKSCLRLSGECNPQLDVDVFCAVEEQEFDDFACLWDKLNAKRKGGNYAWDKNPWVWVYSFERTDKPEGWPLYV